MPTILTHPAVALALAPWLRVRAPLFVAGALCTMLPDLDTIGRHLGVDAIALAHRGPTHSLAFALVVAPALAWLGRGAWRDVCWRIAATFLFVCLASHGLLDMATDGGPGIAWLWPLSDATFFLPWRPIEVSPLDAGRFFGPRGIEVLLSELRWVWLPGLAIAAAGAWRNARAQGVRT
jgi:inner membrane protein